MSLKECNMCSEVKEASEFYSRNAFSKSKGEYIYYHPECKKCTKERSLQWNKDNHKKRLEIQVKANRTPKAVIDQKLNSKRQLEKGVYQKFYKENPEKFREYRLTRQLNKSHDISKDEWKSCKIYFNNSCAYCGLNEKEHFRKYRGKMKLYDLHKEHADPEGANDLSNCLPSCYSCNSQKHDNGYSQWYTETNMIFNHTRLKKINTWLEEEFKKYIKTQ